MYGVFNSRNQIVVVSKNRMTREQCSRCMTIPVSSTSAIVCCDNHIVQHDDKNCIVVLIIWLRFGSWYGSLVCVVIQMLVWVLGLGLGTRFVDLFLVWMLGLGLGLGPSWVLGFGLGI